MYHSGEDVMNFYGCLNLLLCAVNKQLNDKERVAAALENPNLLDMVDECLAPSNDWTYQYVNYTL